MRKAYKLHIMLYDEGDHICKKDNGQYKIHASNCSYSKSGLWLGASTGYSLSNDDLETIGLDDLLTLDSSTIKDKSFYRYPDLNLPRQKVDLLKEKYNIKVTRNVDKADYTIISKKYLNKIITHSWNSHYNKSVVYEFLAQIKAKDLLSDCALNFFRGLLQDTEQDSMFEVKINTYYQSWNATPNAVLDAWLDTVKGVADKYFQDYGSGRSLMVGLCGSAARSKDVEVYQSMLSNASRMVLDETMIEIIDEGLAVISNDQYDDIEKMVVSSNIDDRSLAVEMLANCNVNKSFDVVSGLYYWHYDWFKNTNNWNTVNVKAFRAQMKDFEGNHCYSGIWSFNNYIQKLARNGKLTKFAVDKTRQLLLDKHLNTQVGSEAEVFTVDFDNLKINDKYKEQIIDD